MTIVLDTNRYSAADGGDPPTLAVLQSAHRIHIPFVVLGELRYGFANGGRAAENERRLQQFLSNPRVRPLWADDQTTVEYARLSAYVRKQGTPIPTDDVWIAALAVQHGLPLYTRDRHFDRLPQVQRI